MVVRPSSSLRRTRRGQFATEAVVVLISYLAFLLIMTVFSQIQNVGVQDRARAESAQAVAQKLADAVNTVHLSGNGTTVNVTLPGVLDVSTNYTANLSDRLAQVNFTSINRPDGVSYGSPLLTLNISAPTTLYAGETYRITESNDRVEVIVAP